jgi:hypothetical protein
VTYYGQYNGHDEKHEDTASKSRGCFYCIGDSDRIREEVALTIAEVSLFFFNNFMKTGKRVMHTEKMFATEI